MKLMISSGVSVCDAVYNICAEAPSGRTKAVFESVFETLNGQSSLAEALKSSGAFPEYMLHLVDVGERTGRLEEVFDSLASYYDREMRVKAMVRSAVAYPLLLFMIIAFIMGVLAWKILPMFQSMFEELSDGVSSSTGDAMRAGLMTGRISAIILIVLLAVALITFAIAAVPGGRRFLLNVMGRLPVISRLLSLMATARFISSMALLLPCGMDISAGLADEAEGCNDSVLKGRILSCLEAYKSGEGFAESMAKSSILTGMESRLLITASKTGEVDNTFRRFCSDYDERVSSSLSKLTSVIETSLVVLLSLMVGAVLISVMLPLARLIAAVG